MSQTSSGESVLPICLAYYNTQKTHPPNWYLSLKTLNIQCQQYQPRQQFHSKSYLLGLSRAFCSTRQTTLRTACRIFLITVPSQSTLIQSGQRTEWLWGASGTGCHSWDHWTLQNRLMESILKSDATSTAGTGRQWHITGKLCQTD